MAGVRSGLALARGRTASAGRAEAAQGKLGVEGGAVDEHPVVEDGASRVVGGRDLKVSARGTGAEHDERSRYLAEHIGEVLGSGQRLSWRDGLTGTEQARGRGGGELSLGRVVDRDRIAIDEFCLGGYPVRLGNVP